MRKSTAKKKKVAKAKKPKPKAKAKKSATKAKPKPHKDSLVDSLVKKSAPINFKAVHDAYEYMQAVGLEEFEYKSGSFQLRLKSGQSNGAVSKPVATPTQVLAEPVAAQAVPSPATPVVATSADVHVIRSPFVGTFYRAPGPNESPFVDVSSSVRSGDVLCIVEAMKLMNEIESDASGKVTKILVEDGTAVEYGEPLFEVEK